MKRMLKTLADPEELSFKVDVYHMLVDAETEIAADTEIKDILTEMGDIDPQALADYHTFQQNFAIMIEYYGFSILRAKDSKSKPYTSRYSWIAYASQAHAADTPLLVRLRVSDHMQEFSPARNKEIRRQEQEEANELGLPAGKRKVTDVVVNNKNYKSYEAALNAVDKTIYSWLERLNIDLTDIEPFGVW